MSGQKINVPMLGVFLGAVAAISAGLLSGVYALTEPKIKLNKQEAARVAMIQVLPEFDNSPGEETILLRSALDWPVKYYVARKEGEIVGYAGEVVTPEGFSGDVAVLASLTPEGEIDKVIVTANTETPGLGTAITDRKVQKTIIDLIKGGDAVEGLVPNKYLDWYTGKTAGESRWEMAKDGESINAKTGA
ncbi:MAG: FMN-binding protein, partial [Kiritimatiellaceae bacterium]|nr:FMN-binding protein [Kiritimatiellaceae bacterium]